MGIPSGMVIECHGLEVCGAGLATKWVRALGSRLPGGALSLQRPGTGFQTQVSKGPESPERLNPTPPNPKNGNSRPPF